MEEYRDFTRLENELPSNFVGRREELKQLQRWGKRESNIPLIIQGPPGIGKTSLALMYKNVSRSDFNKQVVLQGGMFTDPDAVMTFVYHNPKIIRKTFL